MFEPTASYIFCESPHTCRNVQKVQNLHSPALPVPSAHGLWWQQLSLELLELPPAQPCRGHSPEKIDACRSQSSFFRNLSLSRTRSNLGQCSGCPWFQPLERGLRFTGSVC